MEIMVCYGVETCYSNFWWVLGAMQKGCQNDLRSKRFQPQAGIFFSVWVHRKFPP